MDNIQILTVVLSTAPTMITVLIGILINNARINDLSSRMTSLESRLTNIEHKFDTRFDLLIGKVVELDNRLTRIEARWH